MYVSFTPVEFRHVLEVVAEDDEDRVKVYGNAIGGQVEDIAIVAERLERRGGLRARKAAYRIRHAIKVVEARTPAQR